MPLIGDSDYIREDFKMLSNLWIKRFLDLSKLVSTWSKDPSTKVGAVIIDPETKTIVSTGYNGFPRNIEDSEERLNNRFKN